ncbi:hypothetical protein F8M41_024265 [Gigaspora margarita]|uniref:Uncharacterized protein n=1 Tax=Gigaspora margarita TaxID=4874 RepID=A0A8H4ABZ8_GIGMA|nr:hypothetical protein F8M41_024265 [Gigaspora margarita]
MNESNYYFHDEQYFFASTLSQILLYEIILNKVTERSDESFIYTDQNISSSISTSSQVSPYEMMLNTVTECSNESFTYADQNISSSISTSSQVLSYEMMLNTVTKRSDKSFTFADQNTYEVMTNSIQFDNELDELNDSSDSLKLVLGHIFSNWNKFKM